MYARIVNITGAKDIDGGIRWLRDQLPSALKDQKGFRGMAVSIDRAAGVLGVLTLWDTEADRDASWNDLAARRQETQELMGGEMTAATYEELLQQTGDTPPAPGSALLLSPVSMEPARVDQNLAFFRSEVLPRITASQGFQQVRLLMNRQTGQGVGGTVWASEDAMRAHAADAQARRPGSQARGVRFGEMRYREIVFADF